MEGTGLSASDVALINRDNGMGWGDNSFMWIFALLLLGSGNFGFGGNGRAVTEADLCNANSFTELKSSVMNVSDQIASMNIGLTKGLCDMGYTTLAQFNQLEQQLASCCCETQRSIDSVKFDLANYFAAANANTNAGIQKILDKMCADKEAAQAARIQQLELNQALCGVVRYPTQTTYATTCNPFSGCGTYGNCAY